jgi:hypothetical protein
MGGRLKTEKAFQIRGKAFYHKVVVAGIIFQQGNP